MNSIPRSEVLARLRAKIERGELIIGAGAGTGLSARSEEEAGVDLIVVYNSGRYRMAGRGSLSGLLAYGNANELVMEMGREVLPIVRDVPVIAGVNGTDPFFHPHQFLEQLRATGYSGIQNFPTVGLIDGTFRANLEETGMSFALEVDFVRLAHELDFFTTPYVFSEEDATAMTAAGADVVVCHLGLTTGGRVGAVTARSLDDCIPEIRRWADAARTVRDDVIVLVHGGPIAEPEDLRYVLANVNGIHGFYGASSMERLPVEQAMVNGIRQFTSLRRPEHQTSKS